MTEVRYKDTITYTTQGERERERPMNLNLKEDRGKGGKTNASLILCCGAEPQWGGGDILILIDIT